MHCWFARLFSVCDLDACEFLASRRQGGQRQVAGAMGGGGGGAGGGSGRTSRSSRGRGRCRGDSLACSGDTTSGVSTATRLFVCHGWCVRVRVGGGRLERRGRRIVCSCSRDRDRRQKASRPTTEPQPAVAAMHCHAMRTTQWQREKMRSSTLDTAIRHSHARHEAHHTISRFEQPDSPRSLRQTAEQAARRPRSTVSALSLIPSVPAPSVQPHPRSRRRHAVAVRVAVCVRARPASRRRRAARQAEGQTRGQVRVHGSLDNTAGAATATTRKRAHACTTLPSDCNSLTALARCCCSLCLSDCRPSGYDLQSPLPTVMAQPTQASERLLLTPLSTAVSLTMAVCACVQAPWL